MPLVFSYGTLQDDRVQLATFGRRLDGRRDELVGFEPSLVAIAPSRLAAFAGKTHHMNVVPSARADSRVAGTAFEITDDELALADRYEQLDAYRRIAVTLASGAAAWVYVDAGSLPA
jgi:hypothetical protein